MDTPASELWQEVVQKSSQKQGLDGRQLSMMTSLKASIDETKTQRQKRRRVPGEVAGSERQKLGAGFAPAHDRL